MEETGFETLMRFWSAGGSWMYPLMLLGMTAFPLSIGLSLGALVSGKRSLGRLGVVVLLGLATLMVVLGAVGWRASLMKLQEVLSLVNPEPENVEAIRLVGQSEARTCWVFGLTMAMLPAVAGVSLIPLALAGERASLSRKLVGLVPALLVAVALTGVIRWQLEIRAADEAAGESLARERAERETSASSNPGATGSLDKELIRQVVSSHLDEIRDCYEAQLAHLPDLKGKVAVEFVISAAGSVASSEVAQSTIGNPEMETCVAGRVRTWVFPRPEGGEEVVVTYPFAFAPAEQ